MIVGGDKLWDVESNQIRDFYSIPIVKEVKENSNSFFKYGLSFIEGGTLRLSFYNDDYDLYRMIIDKNGTVKKEAWLGFPSSAHSPLNYYEMYVSKLTWNFQEKYQFTNIYSQESIFTNGSNYVDFWGETVIADSFTMTSDFNEGFAIVCTDKEESYIREVFYHLHPVIIDKTGDVVSELYE